jgi:hypothetical protein
MEDAQRVFNKVPQHDVFSWNAILGGHAMHGHGKEAQKNLDRCVKKLYVYYLIKLGKLVCPWKTIFLKLAQGWTASCNNAHQKVNVMPPLTKIHQVNATFSMLIQIMKRFVDHMKPLSMCSMLVPRMCSMNNTQTKTFSVVGREGFS